MQKACEGKTPTGAIRALQLTEYRELYNLGVLDLICRNKWNQQE